MKFVITILFSLFSFAAQASTCLPGLYDIKDRTSVNSKFQEIMKAYPAEYDKENNAVWYKGRTMMMVKHGALMVIGRDEQEIVFELLKTNRIKPACL